MKATTTTGDRSDGRKGPIRRLALLAALLALCGATLAKERVQRRFDQSSGLAASSVYSLCQDDAGFIWIGAVGGLVRYDGLEMRQWAKEIARPISFILSGPAGELLAGEDWGEYDRLYWRDLSWRQWRIMAEIASTR